MDQNYKTEINRALGRKIKERRERLRLTQGELALKADLKRTTVTNVEQGNQAVAVHVLYALAEALETVPAALLPSSEEIKRSLGTIGSRPDDEEEFIRLILEGEQP